MPAFSLLWWCLMHSLISTSAFNLEPRLAIVKVSPFLSENTTDYFGYALATHQIVGRDSLESVILVGAPRHNGSGSLFKCPLTIRRDDCKVIKTAIDNDQWLGAVVGSQGPGGKVIVCAPRFTRRESHAHLGHGQCATLDQKLESLSVWDVCEGRANRRVHEEWGVCQAGQSALLTSEDIALIGAPGSYTWRGSIFALSVSDDFLLRDKKHYHTSVGINHLAVAEKHSYLGSSLASGDFLGQKEHMGACVSKLIFASGAPRALGKGEVVIFSQCRDRQRSKHLRVHRRLRGEKVAGGFGAAIVALDFDGDKRPELLVAAPFNGGYVYYYYNQGAQVGLSEDGQRVRFEAPQRTSLETRFGFALANAGDLDADGRQDLVVGAPYDERGRIFVYMGRRHGDERLHRPDQIIAAQDFDHLGHRLRSFGYSLSSPGLDLDLNNHSDLAVGAFESDAVVLIRTRPVIDLITWFGRHPKRIDAQACLHDNKMDKDNKVCFELEACFRVDALPAGVDEVSLKYRLQADAASRRVGPPRASFISGQHGDQVDLNVVQRVGMLTPHTLSGCFVEPIALDTNLRDVTTPIGFRLSLSIEQSSPSSSSQRWSVANINAFPILNQKEAVKELFIPFKLACGDDDRCDSSLSLSMAMLEEKRRESGPLVIESKERDLMVVFDVVNEGEAAYEAVLRIDFDTSVFEFVGRVDEVKDVHCDLVSVTSESLLMDKVSMADTLECRLGNPFASNRSTRLMLKFLPLDMTEVAVDTEIEAVVLTSSINSNSSSTKSRLDLRLERRSELTLFSSVQPRTVFMDAKGAIRGESAMRTVNDVGIRVTHTFQVSNDGPWDAKDVRVRIRFPHQLPVEHGDGRGRWLLYLVNEPEVSNAVCVVNNPRMVNALGLPLGRQQQGGGHRRRHHQRRQLRVLRRRELMSEKQEMEVMGTWGAVRVLECSGSSSCLIIDCHMASLASNSSSVIRLRSRLWNATLADDELKQGLVAIHTSAEILSSQSLQTDLSDDHCLTMMFVVPAVDLAEKLPRWLLLLAVLIGFLIVALITATLYKLGFFRRRRVPKDHHEQDRERAVLLHNNEDKMAPATPRFHNDNFIS